VSNSFCLLVLKYFMSYEISESIGLMLINRNFLESINVVYVYLEPIFGDQKALAFTPQQYAVAENIMGGVSLIYIQRFTACLSCTLGRTYVLSVWLGY